MKTKTFPAFLTAVIVLSSALFGAYPSNAEEIRIITAPQIELTKLGGPIKATGAIWSSSVSSKFVWLINGKVQASLKSKTISSPAKKGTVIQFSESTNGITALSNKIIIGNVAVNGLPVINFQNATADVITVNTLKTFPINAKISYQWFSGPFEVKGGTKKNFQIATGDQGNEISLQITASAKGFGTTTVTSNSIVIPVVERKYQLAWTEDFQSQKSLNPQIWKPENGDGTEYKNRGWGNKERQYYLASQISFDATNGLNINATRTGADKFNCYYGTPCEWISSKYVTKGLVGFKYGRIEAKIKGPVGNGSWAAFWMLGANIDERPWPGCGEIDVTELLGRDPNTVYGTPHGPASGQSYTTSIDSGFAKEFHTYAVDWLPDQITWYLDGKPYGSLNKSSLVDPEHTWIFDHEYYLLVNLAMGGTFGGEIDAKLQQSSMSIQWIKYSTINGVGELIKH